MRVSFVSSVSIAAFAALLAAPAYAQQADEGQEDIIVTATRVESLASKTPIALTAIRGDELSSKGVTDPSLLPSLAPNLSVDRGGSGLQITIRGVTSTDLTEKGDPSAAFLVDGVYLARPTDADVSFFDIDRVEVLRGPQGTLFGRNSTAGVIHMITARPKLDGFSASVEGGYGNLDAINATAMVNIPLGDTVAVRGAVNFDQRDNYFNALPGALFSIDPSRKNLSGRLSVLFKISESASLVLRGDYTDIGGSPAAEASLSNFFPGPLVTGVNPVYVDIGSRRQRIRAFQDAWQTRRNNHTMGVNAEFNADLGGANLTYVGSYRESGRDDRFSIAGGLSRATVVADYWQTSHEVRLAFGGDGPLQGQVGGYFFKERSSIDAFALDPLALGLGAPPIATRFGFDQDPTINTSYAGFGQFTYELAEGLRVTGGLRYSKDEKSRVGGTVIDVLPGFVPGDRIFLQVNDAKRSFDKLTWRAGIDYDVPGAGLIYATVSTGYKAGGFNDGCEIGAAPGCSLPAAALYYEPETLTSYEAGFKLRLADGQVRLNGALFHYDYKNLQLSQNSLVCGIPCQVTRNAARAKVDGIELEASLRPHPNHVFDLGFNYINARYAEYLPTPTFSFAGRPLDRSPKITASAGYSYTLPLSNDGRIEASVRMRLSSKFALTQLSQLFQYMQPSYTKTDVSLTYHAPDDRWFVQAYGRNLEDSIVLSGASSDFPATAAILEPRTYGVRVGVKF